MSIKAINESFEKMYSNTTLNESTNNLIEDISPELKDLTTALFKTLTQLENSGETNIKKYEVAFQDTIEEQFPEKSWWEVTDCDIFSDLFETRDPQKTVINIISKAKSDLTECDRGTKKVLEALRRIANKLTEAPMSDEDRRDSDLIRNAYDKIQKRSNARLTPEEQAVLDKYGIERGHKDLSIDSSVAGKQATWNSNSQLVNNPEDQYSHGRDATGEYRRMKDGKYGYTKSTKDPSKINYADRARKRPERLKNRSYEYVDYNDDWGRGYARDGVSVVDYNRNEPNSLRKQPGWRQGRGITQNMAINNQSKSNLNRMKAAIYNRNDAQQKLDDAETKYNRAKSRYDSDYMKAMKKAEDDYDMNMKWAKQDFDKESDPTRRDKAQDEIDTLLKRKKTEALDTEGTRKLINKVKQSKSLTKALETVYQSILKGSGLGTDAGTAKAKRKDLSNIEGTMTKALQDDRSWEKASSPAEMADKISQILSKVERPSKKKNESLKEAWTNEDLKSDVYNALSDVMFKWHEAGYDLNSNQVDFAYEWFVTHFWEYEMFEED